MIDGRADKPIQDCRGQGAKQGVNPVTKSTQEAPPLEEVEHVAPLHRVKGFVDVKLEKDGRCFILLEPTCKVPNVHEVVMDAPLLDESTLGVGNKVVHEQPEKNGRPLGYDLYNGMTEANGRLWEIFSAPLLCRSAEWQEDTQCTMFAELSHRRFATWRSPKRWMACNTHY